MNMDIHDLSPSNLAKERTPTFLISLAIAQCEGLVMVRLVDVEDRVKRIVREALAILSGRTGQQPVASAAATQTPRTIGSVLITQLRCSGDSSLHYLRQLERVSAGKCRIVVWAHSVTCNFVLQVLNIGISGVLLEPASPAEVAEAIRSAAAGGTYLSSMVRLVMHPQSGGKLVPEAESKLTRREQEILGLLKKGATYKEIAAALGISSATVNNHLSKVREKLGTHNAIETINKVFPSGPV